MVLRPPISTRPDPLFPCTTLFRSRLKRRDTALQPLVRALQAVEASLVTCGICGNIDTRDPCAICTDARRDSRLLCVVEEVADLWSLDRSRLFPGRYHVLGGRLDRKSTRLNSSH